MEPLPAVYSIKISRNYFLAAILISLFCVGVILWSPVVLAFLLGGFFVGIFFSSRTFRWLIFPTVLILNQFIMQNTGFSFQFGGLGLQPIDWIAILLTGTIFLRTFFSGSPAWPRTGLELPIGIFLVAVALSLFRASDPKAGIINWGHTVLYFMVFYAMVADWKDIPLERIWNVYSFWAVLTAASAVWQFFSHGGERSLGWAGIPLNHVIIPMLCFGLANLSLTGGIRQWWPVVFFALTALATGTRGVWLAGGVLLAFWLFSGLFLKPMKWVAVKRLGSQTVGIVLFLALLFFVLAPLLGQVEVRAEQLIQKGGTVYLRLFLWGVAWRFFVLHPVTGIGAGQFASAVGQFPEMKNLAVFEWTHGLSAHNFLLAMLAETGLVGTFAFVLLLTFVLRLAWRGARQAQTLDELRWGWGLFLLFTVFAVSYSFAGTWDYPFAFFLALLVLQAQRLKISRELVDAA